MIGIRLNRLLFNAALVILCRDAAAQTLLAPDADFARGALGPAADAGVKIEFVDLENPTDFSQIRSEIRKKGPLGLDGRRGAAFTLWKISWDVLGEPPNRAAAASYSAKAKFIRWRPREAPSEDSVAAWNKIFPLIAAHERRHLENARSGAAELKEAIDRKLAAKPYISDRELALTAKDIINKVRSRDFEYDRETDGGRKQGIIFP